MAAEVVALAVAATAAAIAAAEAAAAVIAAAVAVSGTAMAVCGSFMCGGRHTGGISSGQVMRECISSGTVKRGPSSTHDDGPPGARGEVDASLIDDGALLLTNAVVVPMEARRGPPSQAAVVGVGALVPAVAVSPQPSADVCKTVIVTTCSLRFQGNAAVVTRRRRTVWRSLRRGRWCCGR